MNLYCGRAGGIIILSSLTIEKHALQTRQVSTFLSPSFENSDIFLQEEKMQESKVVWSFYNWIHRHLHFIRSLVNENDWKVMRRISSYCTTSKCLYGRREGGFLCTPPGITRTTTTEKKNIPCLHLPNIWILRISRKATLLQKWWEDPITLKFILYVSILGNGTDVGYWEEVHLWAFTLYIHIVEHMVNLDIVLCTYIYSGSNKYSTQWKTIVHSLDDKFL